VNRFRWGVATSAYQIEGARRLGGKGDSIWDRFFDDGHMKVGGDVACDHYHRLDEDLDLIADLGVTAYRFSIAWTRVLPDGEGDVNQAGIEFYRRVVDGLLERGVEPWPTLYHWDLPQALQDNGGWANRSTAEAFADFGEIMAESLPDVEHWITQNEPWVSAFLGHLYGVFAPGTHDWPTALRVSHHLLLSHGLAAERIRDRATSSNVGIAIDCRPARPSTKSDVKATRHFDGFRNRWFFDPVFGLGYPDDMMASYVERGRLEQVPSFIEDGDMERIAAPIDFLGLNYYTTVEVTPSEEERDDPERTPSQNPSEGYTEMGWRVDPDGLRSYLSELNNRYSPKSIVVTENGASYSDSPDGYGHIEDRSRIDYLDQHINALLHAAEDGVPIDGYFVWSLLDNLEWTQGFEQRFGLVWVDQESQERTPKRSFEWFGSVVEPDSPESVALAIARNG